MGDSARLTDLGMELDPQQRAAGTAFLARHASIDTHSHPGRFFLKSLPYETPTTRAFGAPFEAQAIADLNAGQLTDAVGIDHVAIGTDMDANFRPVLRSYRDWGLIPAASLARGMREAEVAKIMGGNFLRLFEANLSARPHQTPPAP